MRLINTLFILLFSQSVYSQDTTVITTRDEKIPLQAVLDIETSKTLYAGQDYTFTLTTSGNFNIRLTLNNAKIQLIENSKKSTAGLRYTVTPIDTGTCSIRIGNQVNNKRAVGLKTQMFSVINYPIPPIHIDEKSSGEIIDKLKDSVEISCSYPKETGIYENYEVSNWEAKIGEKTFSGNGSFLSEELIMYTNQVKNISIHQTVFKST